MKPSESVGSWQQQTLVEAIRLRETLWGPVEDLSESRRARAAGGSFAQRVSARALALARRDGLEQAWTRWWRIARLLLIAMAVLALLAGAGTAAGALGDGAAVTIRFAAPEYGVAPGQAAVLYAGSRVLGGGWIASTEPVVASLAA